MFYQTTDPELLEKSAMLMSISDPWITLQVDLEKCRNAFAGDKEIYVSTENGEVTSFAVLQMKGTFRGYVQSLCVSSKMRNKGLGTKLLSFCENRIFQESPNVFMCVSSFNTGAQRLYERLGYKKIGAMDNFLKDGYAEILLRKTLGSYEKFWKNKK